MFIPIYFDENQNDKPFGNSEMYGLSATNEQYLSIINNLGMPDNAALSRYKKQLSALRRDVKHNPSLQQYVNMADGTDKLCTAIISLRTGQQGEDDIYQRLIESAEDWQIYRNLNLPYQHTTTEIDFVVVANGHFIAIEAKNYHNKIVTITKDGNVITQDKNFVARQTRDKNTSAMQSNQQDDKNLLTQVEQHEIALRNCLIKVDGVTSAQLDHNLHSMIVFGNDSSSNDIDNQSDLIFVRLAMMRRKIIAISSKPGIPTKTVEVAVQQLKNSNYPPKSFPEPDPIFFKDRLFASMKNMDRLYPNIQ